jgi:hypothetical protein
MVKGLSVMVGLNGSFIVIGVGEGSRVVIGVLFEIVGFGVAEGIELA